MTNHWCPQSLSPQKDETPPFQLGNVTEYYAIPVTQAEILGFGQVDETKGFIPFLCNNTGLGGFVIRIPHGRLPTSANTPKSTFQTDAVDSENHFHDHNILLDNTSILDPALSSASLNPSMPWRNRGQLNDGAICTPNEHPPDMISSLPTDFSPWDSQVSHSFATDTPGGVPINYGRERLIVGLNANLEPAPQDFNEPAIKDNALAITEKSSNRIFCDQPDCKISFGRHYDRIRHRDTVHQASRVIWLCPVADCDKSHGRGYSRADKLTEHLWKKHADLGYTKSGV